MAQDLGTLAENVRKRQEAQRAAEGKPEAPVTEKAKPRTTPVPPPQFARPPAKPYVPIVEKTEAQKEALRVEMEAEKAVRARNRGQ